MASSLSARTKVRKRSRLLFKVFLSASVLAVIGGSYWQQQLLKGVDTVGSSLVAQWEAGLPKHSLGNVLLQAHSFAMGKNSSDESEQTYKEDESKNNVAPVVNPILPVPSNHARNDGVRQQHKDDVAINNKRLLPSGFQSVLKRSIENQKLCSALPKHSEPQARTLTVGNKTETIADLPDFGIVDALTTTTTLSMQDDVSHQWTCQVPPATECNATKFTVIFMGYNPDRLYQLKRQVVTMTLPNSKWSELVEEVILVWNGPRNLTETNNGVALQTLATERNLRIFFPLLEGFPNDLMNRYHPRFNITTKAILFYDDDGPFYSYEAILGGFELWKRNSNAQIGAMARRLDLISKRQLDEQASLPNDDETAFVKMCRAQGDSVRYNFHEFANYYARMVLPSGSFLHRNFLCFVWHPALEPVRAFVRAHPVHPDDVTVSTIVSHIAGRAPKVYSRRINPAKEVITADENTDETTTRRRRLQQQQEEYYPRRRLLWQDVSKHDWATMRSMAVNSLVSYFGGINSGSLGWCHGTKYQTVDRKGEKVCDPWMAHVGMLPWMTSDHKPKDTCP